MDMDKIRADIRKILLGAMAKREQEAREVERTDNIMFSENLKGKAIGLHDACYLVDNYLKEYEENKKGNS